MSLTRIELSGILKIIQLPIELGLCDTCYILQVKIKSARNAMFTLYVMVDVDTTDTVTYSKGENLICAFHIKIKRTLKKLF